MEAYIDAYGGRYIGVTPPDEPELLALDFVHSDGSPALTGHYLVGIMSQSDLPSVGEYFEAPGQQILPLVRVADLEPGDIAGVAHASLMNALPDGLQHNHRASSPSCGLSEVSPVSVVTSPLTAPALPSPPLRARLRREQRALFLRVWVRLLGCICER